ncbi:MAG: hypothetical protein RR721_08455 [Aeromonas sp.]|uniref:hypothetical protein n=1 Tax=Aeromonas sp. TaxID=647 RepID=UPI002FCB1C82
MYIIRGEIISLAFEPIVGMLNNDVAGYVGLCRCANRNVNVEELFKRLSVREHLDIITLQLQKYQKWVKQHPELYQGRCLVLKVNQESLLDADFPTLFVPYHRYYPICLVLEAHSSWTWLRDIQHTLTQAMAGFDRTFSWSFHINQSALSQLGTILCDDISPMLQKGVSKHTYIYRVMVQLKNSGQYFSFVEFPDNACARYPRV